jgi:2'-hydroxyisoflavone reductase
MRILILGGTIFLGRSFVEAAHAAGHELTLLHRGKHFDVAQAQGALAACRHVIADRDSELEALGEESFDAVLDTSGYFPRIVGRNARTLQDRCRRYLFVSSISVYRDLSVIGLDEGAPVHRLEDPNIEEITGETYGGLKAHCEQECSEVFGKRSTIVRPGLIVGDRDPSDRFGYWPLRVDRGGRYIAPLPKQAPVQFIDVVDLAAFCLRLLEDDRAGIFNATGRPIPFEKLLQVCHELCQESDSKSEATPPAEAVWVEPDALLERGVGPWMELPLWIPGEEMAGMQQASIAAAEAAGLSLRPIEETVRDSLAWMRSLDRPMRAGLSVDKEELLLGEF